MTNKVQSRGLARRLIRLALAAGVLAGSGWGIYQYQQADEIVVAVVEEGPAGMEHPEETHLPGPTEAKGQSAVAELKNLLHSELTPAAKQTVRSASAVAERPDDLGVETDSALGNRYARTANDREIPAVPPPVVHLPASSTQSQFPAAPPVVPPASPPEPGPLPPGDRYAAVAGLLHAPSTAAGPTPSASSHSASAPTAVPEPVGAGSTAAPSQPEVVTRGQEPVNPLRAEASQSVEPTLPGENQPLATAPPAPSPAEQARAAFQETGQETAAALSTEDVNAAVRPLPPRQPAAPFALGAAEPRSASPGAKLPGPKPLPNNLALNNANLPSQSAESPYRREPPRSAGHTLTPGLTNREGTGRPGERLLEGIQNPSITIEKLAPPEIQVGKKCTFAIRVQNTGQRTAQNVKIHDEVPLGTQLLGTAPRATASGSNLIWDLGTLSVGEERTVEMELIPTEEGELGSVAMVTFATQASAKARSTRPELALQLSCGKPKVLTGDQQRIQIEVSNPGSGDATGVILLATIPSGVSHPAGPALELEIGTLPSGQSRRFELALGAEQAGLIENVMTARADANLQVQASCEFEVIAPKLRVNVKGPEKRFLERPATYQVDVENPGTAPAKDVRLVTHLSKGLKFVKANNLGEYRAATHSVHWSLSELPANQQGTVELVALPVEAGEQTLRIDTQASQGLTDHTEKRVHVEGLAALMFEVVDTQDPIEVGGETVYEIRVTNQGSKSAVNVQVVARMPAGIRAISAVGETGHTIGAERVEFAPLARLDPKSAVTYRIGVQGLQAGDQRVHVQITTDEIQQPITKEESTRVYSDQ